MPSSRIEQLNEWERSRRAEVKMDVYAHWSRSAPIITLAVAAWAAVNYFHLEPAYTPGLCDCVDRNRPDRQQSDPAASPVGCGTLRDALTEVEALLINESPMYDKTDDVIDFARNPLFTRLDALESAINRLRPGT